MLIKLSVENFKSFDQKEELSMVSSSKMQGNKNHRMKIKQTQLLKNAVVYGANASGKSNLVTAFAFIKTTLMEGLPVGSANDFCRNKEANKERESVFELQFTVGDTFYAYGFSAILSQRKITEEWLFELNFVSDELKNDKDFMLQAIEIDGFCIYFASDKLKNDEYEG